MNRLLAILGMSVGGWIGWVVGAWISFFTAFILGVIGTGVGLYAARRFSQHYLP